ncbi:flagellar hook-length control protein FliK [Pseudoalteromonas phenolica]|uniref:flagellar hook-length control protein FliK n=1 Tax=Pseudoalteromonas phenolica TaxID=161398 RepID=UPI00110AB215|nr:flagellar hook-length control protein FliK [Pseudoalteromonas phenolica]
MNELPIINLSSVSSESISTLSEANRRALHNSIGQSFLAKNISIKSDSISMDIEINGRWQTVRLAIEPHSQKLELPEAIVKLDETGLKLTLQTPKQGLHIKATDQLLSLLNFLKGDSIGPNITTHAEIKTTPASLQLPKLDVSLAINPSLAKILAAEPKLIAKLNANTAQVLLTISDRFGEQLLKQPIAKNKITQSLTNSFPSMVLNFSEKAPKIQHPVTKAALSLRNIELLSANTQDKSWRAATLTSTMHGLEISEKSKQYAIQLKHSAKSMLTQATKLERPTNEAPLKSGLSYDKPLLNVSFKDVKQAVRTALQNIIAAPFMLIGEKNSKNTVSSNVDIAAVVNKLPTLNKTSASQTLIYPEAKNLKSEPIVQLFSQIRQTIAFTSQFTITAPLKVPEHLLATTLFSQGNLKATPKTSMASSVSDPNKLPSESMPSPKQESSLKQPKAKKVNTEIDPNKVQMASQGKIIPKEAIQKTPLSSEVNSDKGLSSSFVGDKNANKSEQLQTPKASTKKINTRSTTSASSDLQSAVSQLHNKAGKEQINVKSGAASDTQSSMQKTMGSITQQSKIVAKNTNAIQQSFSPQSKIMNDSNQVKLPSQSVLSTIKNHYVPSGSLEKLLIKPFIAEQHIDKAEKLVPEVSSEKINKLSRFKDEKSPDLSRLVHHAFSRMIDEKQHSSAQIANELNLPNPLASAATQTNINTNLQNSSLLNNVEKLLLTFLSAPKMMQNENNDSSTQAKFDALLKTLQPNFKAQNIGQLQQNIPNLNSPLMSELVQLNNSLQQNMVQSASLNQNQNQSSDTQLLVSLFLPTKLPDNCKQTHLQIGNYKKPAKGNLPEKTVWYIRLHFDYSSLGKLSVQAELMDKSLECQVTGNSSQVCALAQPHLDILRRKLSAHGLKVGDIELTEDSEKTELFFSQHTIVNIQV